MKKGRLIRRSSGCCTINWLRGELGDHTGLKARFYTITDRGCRQLIEKERSWSLLTETVVKELRKAQCEYFATCGI